MIETKGLKRLKRNEFENISEVNYEILELRYKISRWDGGDFLPEEEEDFRMYINNKYPAYKFDPEEPESLPYNSAWILESCTPKTYRNWLKGYYEELSDVLYNDLRVLKKILESEREKTRREWETENI